MTVDDEIRRAQEAQQLMDHPMMREAFDKAEAGIVALIKTSVATDKDAHHKLAVVLQTVHAVRGYFKTILETGKLARLQKESIREKAVRLVSRR